MSKKTATARIQWLPPDAGGRKKPPTGPKYSTIIHFADDVTDWPQDVWSIVVEFDEPPGESLETIATIWLLACDHPDAPNHLLRPESKFELLEGYQIVARGEVLRSW